MADKPQSAGSDDAPLDLSALDFGPSWAREKPAPGGKKEYKEYKERPERGRGGDRRDHRGGKGGGGGGRQRREGGGRKFDNRERGRGKGRRDSRERRQREDVPPPADVTGQILPVEEGLDALAREVLGGGRTYSVFDLAKVVMGARERFNVGFKSAGEARFIRCKKDGAVWLTRAEALAHFSRSKWRKDYYGEIVTDAEPPKGNFQAVAVCGISNQILGPPNYHGYQSALMQLHRERFSNMPIERYKSKIRMERGEEAVNAWIEKMSKQVRFLPKSPEDGENTAKPVVPEETTPTKEEETAAQEVAEAPAGEVAGEEEPAAGDAPEGGDAVAERAETPAVEGETPAAESIAEETPGEEVAEGEAPEAEEAPAPAEEPAHNPEDLLPDLQAVEKHFLENHFKEVYIESSKVWVPGGIAGNLVSPGLLTLLRETVSEERRYPGKLTPMLCRQLSGRHVAVFKWQKKLKVGPSRPHEVPADIQLAERPQKLLEWVRQNSGESLEKLWADLLPKDVTDAVKHEWYHDLHWLLNQGYVLLLADSTVHLSKKPGGSGGGTPPKKEAPKKEPAPNEEAKSGESEVNSGDAGGTPPAAENKSPTTAGEPEAPAEAAPPEGEGAGGTEQGDPEKPS